MQRTAEKSAISVSGADFLRKILDRLCQMTV